MHARDFLTAALVFLVLSSSSALPVRAEEETAVAGLDPAVVKRLQGKLRSRAAAWWRYRKPMASRCPQCKGSGKVLWRKGRRRTRVDCPKCDGHKMYIDKSDFRHCFYELRSPAFRMREDAQARATEEFIAARAGNPMPVIIKSYSLKQMEIVDATHGIAYIEKNGDSVARPQRWILAKEGRKPETWYFYDAAADGPWPGDEAATDPRGQEEVMPEEPETFAPLPTEPEPPVVVRPPAEPAEPIAREKEPERATREESLPLIMKWTEERNDCAARVIRIEMGLDEVEGYEEKVAAARRFVKEIKGWLDEEKEAYERALNEVEEQGLGVRLGDRLKINTIHFKAHRRLELVEQMLVAILPELGN